METKKCARCGRELPLDDYHRSKRAKDGRQSYCKECKKEIYLTGSISDDNNTLAAFTTEQLTAELKRRGCKGHVELVSKIEL